MEADRRLHDAVKAHLGVDCSPAQVAGRLRVDLPDDEAMRVSHETIYQCLYLQARGELRTDQYKTLAHQRKYLQLTPAEKEEYKGLKKDERRTMIDVRDKDVAGDWERVGTPRDALERVYETLRLFLEVQGGVMTDAGDEKAVLEEILRRIEIELGDNSWLYRVYGVPTSK